MESIDFFKQEAVLSIKKKTTKIWEITQMKSQIVFLGHGKKEERDSKINLDMYTHCSDVVVQIMGVFS